MNEPMSLIVTIAERGKGAGIIRLYTGNQIYLHCQCSGRGTATSEILDILGLASTEKDVILSYGTTAAANQLLHQLDNDLRGAVSSGGIAFSIPLTALSNLVLATLVYKTDRKGDKTMPNDHKAENSMILITCKPGCSQEIMETAKKAGARGGTVLRARWSGAEELEKSYGLTLSPERELLIIVVPTQIRNAVMENINAQHSLRSESEGMICSVAIDQFVRL